MKTGLTRRIGKQQHWFGSETNADSNMFSYILGNCHERSEFLFQKISLDYKIKMVKKWKHLDFSLSPPPRAFSFKLVKPLNGQWFEKRYISIVYFIINNNYYRNVNEIDTVPESLPYVQSEKGPRLSKHPWYCSTSSLYWRWPRLWT